ncbi:CBS domain-containing protein [Paraburkholderia youngii]|uniref:CBS domain-containing protein n=1 Tax=Paraburkholderia youngii TaxID=2782701 RepID=A0A7Y6K7C6_9BURK|nr:CBS domain-containing protein [Paraburkholderia youngii]NUY05234.1 CBS domain-containing protein [Paraburkholderia youngii]
MTTVAEVMTRNPASIGLRLTIREAAQLMTELNVGVLPVCEDGEVVGMLTDRDIVTRAVALGASTEETIEGIVSGEPSCCYEDDDVQAVKDRMADAQVRRIPVVDQSDHLIGILSLGDLATRSDDEISSTLGAISTPCEPER